MGTRLPGFCGHEPPIAIYPRLTGKLRGETAMYTKREARKGRRNQRDKPTPAIVTPQASRFL